MLLTPGQAHDVTAYDGLMAERDNAPAAMLGDKGYASDAIRQDLRGRGAAPEIPTRSNRTLRYALDKQVYKLRSRIERLIGHLKEDRRVATRFVKTERPKAATSGLSCSPASGSASGLYTKPSGKWWCGPRPRRDPAA